MRVVYLQNQNIKFLRKQTNFSSILVKFEKAENIYILMNLRIKKTVAKARIKI